MKIVRVTLLALLIAPWSVAQDGCGQHMLERALRASDPGLEQRFRKFTEDMTQGSWSSAARAETRIVPVVFHVIHANGPENISDEQIYDAMRILNKDFQALNDEIGEIIPSFENIIGDADIEFRLARKDPAGNATTGIDRIQSNETFVGDDGSKLNPWPRDQYLNIWVTDVIAIAQAAAYAYRPPAADGMPQQDGVIANHRYVGSVGTGSSGSSSKTLTHEIGHYLGLPHTWGETNDPGLPGNCSIDDGISDTPNTIGVSNASCNLSQVTCGSLDNVQNFMDYASCEAMFTDGQINLMRNVLASALAQRNQLGTSSNLAATGVDVLHEAKFWMESKAICRGDSMRFFDESAYDPDSWSWEITGPETFTSTEQHPAFKFSTPGVYTVELTVSQGGVTQTVKEEQCFAVVETFGAPVPFLEDFSAGNEGWIVDQHEETSGNTWKYETNIGYDDDFSYKMANLGQDPNRVDDLIFSSVDFRPMSAVTIAFKVAFARITTSNNDKLQLDVSDDCGQNWQTIWSASGSTLAGSTPLSTSQFVPQESDWESFSIDNLPLSWFSGNTLLRFRFTGDGGNNLYLDNINVFGEYNTVPQLVYPVNGASSMNDNVVLDWHAAPGVASYEYQLDVASDFSSAALQSGTLTYLGEVSDKEDTRLPTTNLDHGQQYFWRVRTHKNTTVSDWSDTWSFTVAADGVGIPSTHAAQALYVFPNPAGERLTIVMPETVIPSMLSIFDISGQLVLRGETIGNASNEITQDVSALMNGTYLIRIESEHGPFITRFTVSR